MPHQNDEPEWKPSPTPPDARQSLRIVIESDLDSRFTDYPDTRLVSVALDAVRAVMGTINVTRAELIRRGVTVEVYHV